MKFAHAKIEFPAAHQNALLSQLLAGTSDRLTGHLTPVDMPVGMLLHPADDSAGYAYFPIDALISLLSVIENGKSAEIGVVGSEGMIGIEGLIGGRNPYIQAKVQCGGTALRVPIRFLRDEFNRNEPVRWLILRYMQSMLSQIGQAVICNRHHSIEQQLCRKLLMSSDRLRSDELVLTQSTIAEVLGVRREGITAAAGELRKLGVIEYRRGRIWILDRAMLEERSCECYAVLRAHSHHLPPRDPGADPRERTRSPALLRPAPLAFRRHEMRSYATA